MIYLLALMLVLILVDTRRKTEDGATFSLANTNALKGLLAIMVIITHIAYFCNIENVYLKNIFDSFGPIAVGGFFFLSAYGLLKSYERNKESYVKRIFLIKIPTLYLILVFINLIYYLCLYTNSTMPTWQIITSIFNLNIFFGIDQINSYGWFMTTIIVMYIFLGITLFIAKHFKTEKNKKLFIALFLSCAIYGLYWVICLAPITNLYNRALVCFILATWLTLYEDFFVNLFKRKSVWLTSVIVLVMLFLAYQFVWPKLTGGRHEDVLALMACAIMFLLAQKFTLEKSSSYSKLGIISLEFYLFQLLAISTCGFDYSQFPFFKALAIIGLTIVLSALFNKGYNYLKQFTKYLIFKHKQKEKTNE